MQKIPVNVSSDSGRPSREELNQMIADPRYQSDPSFRSKVEKAFNEMYG